MTPQSERIHDDEFDTSERVVRSLLREQCSAWAEFALTPLNTSGTSNALWRMSGPGSREMVARLPRTVGAESSIVTESSLLPALHGTHLGNRVQLPRLLHHGEPTSDFPAQWAVLGWLDGEDAWTTRHELSSAQEDLALDLAAAVSALAPLPGLPVTERRAGQRGGPLPSLLGRLDRWLDDPHWSASSLIDVATVRRSAAQSAEVVTESVQKGFVHGDLIPGNILTTEGRMSAIIDWGGAGYGDLAQDLTPAWAILDGAARQVFREALAVDDGSWLRARAFALEQAVGGVLYYVPRRHSLGDVMARTLGRILADTS
jgi:aminoglycoside phosphotransferase (APT) family kinase protein